MPTNPKTHMITVTLTEYEWRTVLDELEDGEDKAYGTGKTELGDELHELYNKIDTVTWRPAKGSPPKVIQAYRIALGYKV